MPKKRTEEDAEKQLEDINDRSLALALNLANLGNYPSSSQIYALQAEAHLIKKIVDDRRREDRCWYCYSHTKELGWESSSGLCQCIDCAGDAYGRSLTRERQLKERLTLGYTL